MKVVRRRSHPRSCDVNAQPNKVGTYGIVPPLQPAQPVPFPLDCPYCHERLQTRRNSGHWTRRVGDLGDGVMETVDIPRSFVVVACLPCDARFVLPRDSREWPRGEVDG